MQASQGIEYLALNESNGRFPLLIPPRLFDLLAPEHVSLVQAELALAAAGNTERGWIEIRIDSGTESGRWYALRLTPANDRHGSDHVLGILRDVHERRMLEDKLFMARMTDPLTALTNRPAFDAMLEHVTTSGQEGCLGLFEIDHFRAINHRLGYDFGDEVLVGFSQVLRVVMRTGDTLSRIGDAQFAVLFLETETHHADELARQVQEVFAGDLPAGKVTLPLSATAGIAEIGRCPNDTLHRAEMAMVLGKATGSGAVKGERRRGAYQPALPTRAAESRLKRAG